MKKSVIFAGICVMLLVAGSIFAEGVPSSKFSATYSTELGLVSMASVNEEDVINGIPIDFDASLGYTLATIKVPQAKELLVGVSAEIGLVTDTNVKGKLGGEARALAGASGSVVVFAIPRSKGSADIAAPGPVVLASRIQELEATLGGVIESCAVSCEEQNCVVIDPTPESPNSGDEYTSCDIVCDNINIATDCIVTDEQIGLFQATLGAQHFNFVFEDLDQGVYDIKAFFLTTALAAGTYDMGICFEGEECVTAVGTAQAMAFVGKTMVTVQEVRAAKNGTGEKNIIEIP